MEISTLSLARTQFAITVNFHVLFAAFAMTLSWILCVFKYRSFRQPDSAWTAAYRFWVRIFALAFFVALASAVPVLVDFGIIWPALMERAGNVAGPIIACGITTLFVTKSVFFGVMLFGQRRVSPLSHLISVLMVSLGLTATVFWEVVLQSWSHIPQGTILVEGRLQVDDWIEVILNPALGWYGLLYATGGLFVVGSLMLGLTAWQAGRRPLEESERLVYRTGAMICCIAAVLQLFVLDGVARQNARIHPIAAAATMGYWDAGSEPDMVWLGWPDKQYQTTDVLIGTERLAARWLGINPESKDRISLEAVSEDNEMPAVQSLFWLVRIALVGSFLMLLQLFATAYVVFTRGDQINKYPVWLLRVQVWMSGLGAIVWSSSWNWVQLSQVRYLVSGLFREEDLVTNATTYALMGGLVASLLLYLALFAGFIQMVLHAARFGVVPVRKPGVVK